MIPDKLKYFREIANGNPPFTFESSKRNVVVIDRVTGRIAVMGNGSTTIKARDINRSTGEFKLSVSGVTIVVVTTEDFTQETGEAEAIRRGLKLLDLVDAKLIWQEYQPLNMKVGTAIGLGNRYA